MKSVIKEHVKITPGMSGGKPRISGHRIRVMDIVLWQNKCGWSLDEIVLLPTYMLLLPIIGIITKRLKRIFDLQRR